MTALFARLRTWLSWQPPQCTDYSCVACEMGYTPCAYVGPVPWRVRMWRWLVGHCGQHGGRS